MTFPIYGELIEEADTPEFEQFGEVIEEKDIPTPLRHVARSASRAGESILGLPGDVLRAADFGASKVEDFAGKIRSSLGKAPLPKGHPKPGLPGSEELKEFSQKVFGKTVSPQSGREKLADDIIGDAASLLIPIKGKIPFVRSIGSAVAANLAGEGAEKLAGPEAKPLAKMGTYFLSGLTGKGTLKKFWTKEYEKADKAIPKGAILDANPLRKKLTKLERSLKKGAIETPSQKFVMKPLKELKRAISDGELLVEDAVAAKKKLNELRSSLFDEVKGKSASRFARSRIHEISSSIDEALENYGKNNPKFWNSFNAANEAYGGFQQSKKVGNWIGRTLPISHLSKGAILLAELLFKPASLGVTLPAYGGFKAAELLARIGRNPTLRKYYLNAVKDSIKENKTSFTRNLSQLQRGLDKTLKKQEESQ